MFLRDRETNRENVMELHAMELKINNGNIHWLALIVIAAMAMVGAG